MTPDDLRTAIDAAWERRLEIGLETGGETREAVEMVLDGLDTGRFRVAEPGPGGWRTRASTTRPSAAMPCKCLPPPGEPESWPSGPVSTPASATPGTPTTSSASKKKPRLLVRGGRE